MNSHKPKLSAHRRLLAADDDDPLNSVANLFDVSMVFAVALLMALVSRLPLAELLNPKEDFTILKNPGRPNMEIVRREGKTLKHYRISEESLGGDGERLGVAYRLQTGEVVYVPEHDAAPAPSQEEIKSIVEKKHPLSVDLDQETHKTNRRTN